ncbi:MAG: endopeptidase La [Phycisphaerae bacterium]
MDHAAPDPRGIMARLAAESASAEAAAGEMTPRGDDVRETDIPRELPILPVRNVVVFPGTVVPLSVGREKSKRLIDAVLAGSKLLGVCAQRREDVEDPGINDVYRVGTAAQVLKLLRMPDGTHTLLVHGLCRVGLEQFISTDPYWVALVNALVDSPQKSIELEALVHTARLTAEKVIELSPNVPDEVQQILSGLDQPGALTDFLAANLSLGLVQRQELLETFDVLDRLRKVNATLQNQLEVLELSAKIQSDVRTQIDKTQRNYYLQEQMKAIQRELGETDPRGVEVAELRAKIQDAHMPSAAAQEAARELMRLERIPQGAAEYGVIRDHLDWLIEMPWDIETTDNLDLEQAEKVLETDHYGLEKIKRRIVEYLAVRKLNPEGKGPILCFLGPPGVGKTSLGQSIARALGRKFVRIALGGCRDEADIRGHRRTYIGAIPGRIVQELRKCGSRNPVMMLDELDKLGADFRGDPASALLEVLDPEQNSTFTDHYLDVPFDLSKVMFIATANYVDPIPAPLKDRMEVIELASYTTAEKLKIAERYLVPRQKERNGLARADFKFDSETLQTLIERYTAEAGVRNLERQIGTVCRGIAAKTARGKTPAERVRPADLDEYLGQPRFEHDEALASASAGVVTGLAYTPVGGEIIIVEAAQMPGRGGFSLTGQIGDVMRESAQAALSLLRARSDAWRINFDGLPNTDVHVHVPAGAIPKDGPSAGVAMFTALYSLFTDRPANPSVGMTGEITLRGVVLPVGGIKEKVLAGHRAGLKTIVLPAKNKPDLTEIPADVQRDLKFVFAERVEDVVNAAIGPLGRAERGERDRRPKLRRASAGRTRPAR